MTLIKQVKHNSKRCLCNNWGKAVAIVLLTCAVYLLFMIIEMSASIFLQSSPAAFADAAGISQKRMLSFILSSIMSVGAFLLLVPFKLGTIQWYYSLSDGVSEDILAIFSCFANRRMFFRSLWLRLNILVRTVFTAAALFVIPGVGIAFSCWLIRSGVPGTMFAGSLSLVLCCALMLVMLVLFMVMIQKYFLAKYYLLDGKTTVSSAIRSSVHATKRCRDEILLFKLSFIGWLIASAVVLPALYFYPYYYMSATIYARFLMEDDLRSNSLVPVNDEATKQFEVQE